VNNFSAVALVIAIVAAIVLAMEANHVPLTCDPPRHIVVVQTVDGFGHHECVTPTPPPGTPPEANTRR
jgi:hypothetical protein